MSLSSYGRLATEVYDIDKPIGRSFGDVEFYLQRLKSCTGRVLEPAVGTGRVMIPLMEAGLEMEGTDNSPEMLCICRARCAERGLQPVLYEGDMGSLSLPERYEAIIVPAGSFLLIERREESLGALQRFREHLLPGGCLILDLELQTDFSVGAISTGTVQTPQGETITVESKVVEVNFLEQYSVSHLRCEKWREGELVRTEMQRFALRWYGLEEFELVLRNLGFSEVVVSADYEYGKRPTRADQTFTFEARLAQVGNGDPS
jgi:ubiquinone/menaquinone biosynthesis C-methylase UbiE